MVSINRLATALSLVSAAFAAAACGGGGGSGPGSSTISGTISGLVGTVVLQDNGGDALTLTSNGSFTFPTSVPAGQPYAVTVLTQPTGPDCTVTHSSGTATGTVVSVPVSCSANPATFYLPLAAQPPLGKSVGTTGLFAISSKEPAVSPMSIFAGATKPIGYSFNLTLNGGGSVSQGPPTTLAFSSSGAAGGDHLYAVDLTANSSLLPVQIGNLTFPKNISGQNCGVVDAYDNLSDPTTAFYLIAIPTDLTNLCGGGPASVKWYLVHLADSPSTAPVELPSPNGPIVALYHATGALAGFLTVDQSNQLVFFSDATFTNPKVLLSGVTGFGTLQGPLSLFTQINANPAYAFIAVQSATTSYSLYRVDDRGTLSADLYDFQGSYDNGVISDPSNLYVTDSYGTSTTLIERIVQAPLNGTSPATILFQYMPTDTVPYYVVGTVATRLILEKPIPSPTNGPISVALATLPIRTPATPSAIAIFSSLIGITFGAGEMLITQTIETGTVSNPTFTYSTEVIGPDGTVIQPSQANAAFLAFGSGMVLAVTGVPASSGYGGGSVAVADLTQSTSPALLPLKNPNGTAFALPTDSEFVSNTPVTANAGWVADLGATSNSQFFYDSTTLTIVPVSIPTSQVGLVFAPTP
jgi:hypothetical protein